MAGKIGFMCKVDFDHELGGALDGCCIYATLKELKEKRPCVKSCGAVRVRVILDKMVLKPSDPPLK